MEKSSVFLLASCLLLLASAVLADPGVIIEAKGGVTVTQSGKAVAAKSGTKFLDGAVIDVAQGGSAALMFSNGAVKKLASGEKYTAAKSAPGQPAGGSPLVKGIAMAYNDATRASSGPTVHGMVKAAPGQKTAKTSGDATLSPERVSQMKTDLKQVDDLGLDHDGRSLMQAQVYYKYQQYKKMVDILTPVYNSQQPPTEMVKNLMTLAREKSGK